MGGVAAHRPLCQMDHSPVSILWGQNNERDRWVECLASLDLESRRLADSRSRQVDSKIALSIFALALMLAFVVTGCSSQSNAPQPLPQSYYQPQGSHSYSRERTEVASWYGPGFAGRRTSSGERFDPNSLTAASRTLPLGSHVKVTNPSTGKSVVVRINDRGPHLHGRSLDLSRRAAEEIGMKRKGVARVRVASMTGGDSELPLERAANEDALEEPRKMRRRSTRTHRRSHSSGIVNAEEIE
jgi:peptidoglycan lytic transglycosylase